MLARNGDDPVAALLDRPIWTALTTRHRRFAQAAGSARCFPPEISPFAATRGDTGADLDGLEKLVAGSRDTLLLLQCGEIAFQAPLRRTLSIAGVQMIALDPIAHPGRGEALRLNHAAAHDMLALTRLAKPGPFELRTHLLGTFWGIRRNGRLIAMAGERLKQPGFTEISAVCVHPEHRGKGLAQHLVRLVAANIQARGETPYLHVLAEKTGAIRLYRRLGFNIRCDVSIACLERENAAAEPASLPAAPSRAAIV